MLAFAASISLETEIIRTKPHQPLSFPFLNDHLGLKKSVEKEFSAQERLNYLMILRVHKERTDSLDIKSVIKAILIIIQTLMQNLKQNELYYYSV